MVELVAAGAILWRRSSSDLWRRSSSDEGEGAGGVEVAVVHRPRYDDWSWPKGKPQPREALAATAVREVAEETGCTAVLGPRLGSTHYPVPTGRKVVHYWSARAGGGHFAPDDEVDQVRWLSPADAADLLSYPHDRSLLTGLANAVAATSTVLLVRHAKAGKREEWSGDDTLRPLTAAGRRQAEALRTLLALFGPQRVHSAPLVRCRQTVEGLAADLGMPVVDEPLLSENGYLRDPPGGQRRLTDIAAGTGPAVVCSQGGVIPELIGWLATEIGLPVSGRPPSRKGSFWALYFGSNPATLTPLVADYYDDPLS